MPKKYTVFVSSTYEDLKEERDKVFKQILRNGFIPIGMEMFNAGNIEEWELIKRTIDESDYYVLIIRPRFGSIDNECKLSYTQKEYQYAKSIGIPRASFIMEDGTLHANGYYKTQDESDRKRLGAFIKEVKSNDHMHCASWCNKDELAGEINLSLNQLVKDSPRPGWTKNGADLDLNGLTDHELLSFRKESTEQLLTNEGNVSLAKEYYSSFDNCMYHWMKKQTYIDMFQRVVRLKIIDDCLEVRTTTQIDYINTKEGVPYYLSSPRFETETEANSYKTISFAINGEDLTDKIESEVSLSNQDNPFPYLVQNQFPLKYDNPRVSIRHETLHLVPLDRFIQTYMLIFPCRSIRCDVILDNDYNNSYRIVTQPFSSFNVHTYDRYEPQNPINKGTITIPRWALPGSGYEVILQSNEKKYHEDDLLL